MNEDQVEKYYKKVDTMAPGELDALGFGAIQLDGQGKVLQYNLYEGQLAGLDPTRVVGKNFFRDVAPCTDVKEFAGQFREGVKNKTLYTKFRYRFMFKHQPPRNVLVTLYYSRDSDSTWVFVQAV